MKRLIRKILHKFGLEIRKKSNPIYDLSIYQDLYSEDSIENNRFYNIGAGGFYHPYWTNIDKNSDWYSQGQKQAKFINYDLFSLSKFDIQSDTAEVFYTSHTIEHITNKAAQHMFKEAHRCLKKGGVFRITTPNIELDFIAYKNNDMHYYSWIKTYSQKEHMARIKITTPMDQVSIAQIFIHHFASQLSELHEDASTKKLTDDEVTELFRTHSMEEALDIITVRCSIDIQNKYPGNHINWWNFNKLNQMLEEVGFKDIRLSGYSQSIVPILRNTNFFDNTHPKSSLYVEAIK